MQGKLPQIAQITQILALFGLDIRKRIFMAQVNYYPEDVLIEKMQEGQYGWLDYVNHHSREWQEEYARYCASMGVCINEHSAEAFVYQKDMELEEAMLRGDA